MNLRDFRSLVLSIARTEGAQYLRETDVAQLDDLIEDGLATFARLTRCNPQGAITFTPVVGTAVYELLSTDSFARPMAAIRNVFIEGVPLLAFGSDRPGPSSEDLAASNLGGYLTTPNGRPYYWWPEGELRIRFDRPFDSAYSCTVAGDALPVWTGIDARELDLAAHHVTPAARYVASELLFPFTREVATQIRGLALKEMEEIMARVGASQGGRSVRGGVRTRYRSLS